MASDNKLIEGQWYWITYPYIRRYLDSKVELKMNSTELKKCLVTKNDGTVGLFKSDRLGNLWREISCCVKYEGRMKREFIFFGESVPDV